MSGVMRRAALAFVVAVALLASLGAITLAPGPGPSPVGVATADNQTEIRSVDVSVDRQDKNVSVRVSSFAFDGDIDDSSIKVTLANQNVNELDSPQRQSGKYVFTTDINSLIGDGPVTEPRPSITVDYPDGSKSRQVDVRLLEFGSTGDLDVDGGTYRFPVERAIGLSDGTTVPMRISNERFDAVFKCGNKCGAGTLEFDPTVVQNAVSPLSEQKYVVYPDEEFSTSQSFDLSSGGTVEFDQSGDGVTISHPLLFGGSSYVVAATTQNPQGRYVVEQEATEPGERGQVTVPSLVTRAGSLEVTVFDSESREIISSVSPPDTDPNILASYDNESRSFNFTNPSKLPSSIETVWVNDTGTIQRFDAPVRNGSRLELNLTNATVPRQFLIVGDGTTVPVRVERSKANQTGQTNQTPTGQTNQTPTGLLAGNGVEPVLSNVLHLLAMGTVGVLAILLSAWVGQKLRPVFNTGTLLVGLIVLVLGVVFLWRFGTEWFGIHLYALFAIGAVGLVAGTLRTFDKGLQGQLIDAGMAFVAVVVFGVVLGELLPGGLSLTGLSVISGGWVGTAIGSKLAAITIDPKHPVTVQLVDRETGELVRKNAHVTLQNGLGANTKRVKVTGGTEQITVSEGEWQFSSGTDAVGKPRKTLVTGKSVVKLPVERADAKLQVISTADDSPLTSATVTIEPEANSTDRVKLNHVSDGVYTGNLPAGVSTATVYVACDRYRNKTQRYEGIGGGFERRVRLAPKRGTLEVNVTLEGEAVGGIPVNLTAGAKVQTQERRRELTTNQRGQTTESGLAVGRWDVEVELPGGTDEFEIESIDSPVTITEDETSTVRTDVRFTYKLPPGARRQLSELRDRLDSIASHPRSDVAIPSFYVSVIHELLDAVEGVPAEARTFLSAGESPDETVEALLTAAQAGTDAIANAMSSKQNVDLFAACGDMAAVEARWDGTFDLGELFDVAAEDSRRRQTRIKERLDEVDETISQELRDLSEVRPAQEMWEETRNLARDTNHQNLEMASLALLTLGLLDAIESLFERDPLRERMTRTVF